MLLPPSCGTGHAQPPFLVPKPVPYCSVTLVPPMVRRREEEVTCQVPGYGKTMPLRQMRTHISFHLCRGDLHALVLPGYILENLVSF